MTQLEQIEQKLSDLQIAYNNLLSVKHLLLITEGSYELNHITDYSHENKKVASITVDDTELLLTHSFGNLWKFNDIILDLKLEE
jgi:hypothetical protein